MPITVLRPDVQESKAQLAAREAAALPLPTPGPLPEGALLTIIENGKFNAGNLLGFIAEELHGRFSIGRIEVVSKPSSGRPITDDEARLMAARSHLVLTGVGD